MTKPTTIKKIKNSHNLKIIIIIIIIIMFNIRSEENHYTKTFI